MGGTFNAVFGPDAGKALMITLAKSEEEQTKTVSPLEKALRSKIIMRLNGFIGRLTLYLFNTINYTTL